MHQQELQKYMKAMETQKMTTTILIKLGNAGKGKKQEKQACM